MFDNLNWWEIGLLLMLALLIFGDRLPQIISDGLRMVRNLRNMARNATSDLGRELGTDIQLEDLHPKAFIRKHLLTEEDEAALRKPLQGMYDDLKSDVGGVRDELRDVAASADLRKPVSKSVPSAQPSAAGAPAAAGESVPAARPVDVDAT
jgi:sec-independent protein translocase protein TatB